MTIWPLGADSRLRPLHRDECPLIGEALAGLDPWARLRMRPDALTRWLDRPDPALQRWVLEWRDQAAGLLALRHPWLRGPFIETLAIFPTAQGRGFGSILVDWAAAQGLRLGSTNLWASVSDFNQDGRRFWRRQGFAEVGRLEGLIRPDITEWLLRRVLQPEPSA